jgi:hypothetical protein
MSEDSARPIPLLGDISLEAVVRMEHSLEAGFVPTRIAGLQGELQQRTGRPSHRFTIAGVLFGEKANDQVQALQKAAQAGDELTFSADIATALELQKVVITRFRAVETAGKPNYFDYEVSLAESPPLPPPAQVEPFGGLGDFGLGDLGFDTDILGDLAAQAGAIAGAIDDAMNIVNQLGALANLDGLELGSFLEPLTTPTSKINDLGSSFGKAAQTLSDFFKTS